ncbi:Na+/H+ antiporter subunit E [Xylanimonas ulmi]|uniref:Multisubunit sodium/proton antiporter MrpE subunit n=1 Tax=Xylanimonas ulmi TaxID=228973 RepID=A0A4Q7M3B9_9MICO|nr:Na+/H+ antiporter subunit E [Xylanibacterium ulmi]RZS62405.1 multisubunit sodium/proton antiporter MrpE subunit [Xylanibacterium ulmi]
MPHLTPTRRNRLRRVAAQWPSVLLLGVLWMALWGSITWGTFLAGLLAGLVVVALLPLPPVGVRAALRPWRAVILGARFAADLVVASFQVAWTALRPGTSPRGGVVAVPLRPAPDVFFAMTAELSSLVPGSLVVEADTRTATLYLHVLDLDAAGGPDAVREQTLHLEERVLRAFASRADLARAGLAAPPVPAGSGETVSGQAPSPDAPRPEERP